jgi:hypothetical protein
MNVHKKKLTNESKGKPEQTFVLEFYFAGIVSARSTHLWEKGKDPDPYLWLMDPNRGGPKKCGSGSGSPNTGFQKIKQKLHIDFSVELSRLKILKPFAHVKKGLI